MSREDKKPVILVVDDDEAIKKATASVVEGLGFVALLAGNGAEALEKVGKNPDISLVLLDIMMPVMDGMTVLKRLKELRPGLPIIMMTAHGDVNIAAKAAAFGATGFAEKPCFDELPSLIKEAFKARDMINTAALSLPSVGGEKRAFVSRSQAMADTFLLIDRIVSTDTTVLIEGESGTGKGLLAEAIHHNSSRRRKRFVVINCAAIPAELLESELFGHEKGAFTGADERRIGKFEYAAGGTLFLDEIGEMPLNLQAKLLRVLQDRAFERVGGNRTISTDVRIISATNVDLRKKLGVAFREDLYWRLNVMNIQLPPLRERPEDIQILSHFFLDDINQRLGRNIKGFSQVTVKALQEYPWPGNIRELKNALEHSVVVERGEKIQPLSLPSGILEKLRKKECENKVPDNSSILDGFCQANKDDLGDEIIPLNDALLKLESQLIGRALMSCGGKLSLAADKLQIELRTLQRKVKRLKELGLL